VGTKGDGGNGRQEKDWAEEVRAGDKRGGEGSS